MARKAVTPKKKKANPPKRTKPIAPPAEGGDNPSAREDQFIRERTTPLTPKGGPPPAIRERGIPGGEDALEPHTADTRRDLMDEYRRRQRERQPPPPAHPREAFGPEAPQAPGPPQASNWIPIGPSVVRQGQGGARPATGGRTPAIAVAPGGNRVYIGAANGGVWRSDDAGQSWRSLMDAFDLNPTTPASDSLAVGALAIDPANPDRVYVGSGEGAGGAYFGVGPIVTDNGGAAAPAWRTEPVAPGSDPLAGTAFYALAVDPANPERVVAATLRGAYRREPDGAGGFHWAQKAIGGATRQRVTSVVAAITGGVTTFFASCHNGLVFRSGDGHAWTIAGAGFPTGLGRICLGCQPDNPNIVYALASTGAVYRLDAANGNWQEVSGVPASLTGTQGWYDLAVAVAPDDPNRVYLGGSTEFSNGDWSGSAYRCEITLGAGGPSATATYIGGAVHADVHTLVFAPGDPNQLWLGCDGGVFLSTSPAAGDGGFVSRNLGYQTLMMEHLGQHPTEEAVLFCGTQDNGCVRYTGEEAWLYSAGGDCGYALIHWRDPYKALSTYVEGTIRRTTNGGQRYAWSDASVPVAGGDAPLFYAPIAGVPPNPASPTASADADLVAFGSVRPWISPDFGASWRSIPHNSLAQDSLGAQIRSLAFASPNRLYAGTMNGGVYRFDRAGATWTRTQIDTLGGPNQLVLSGAVTDIAVDPANPDRLFVTLGGTGDFRHVWFFDGAQWAARGGPGAGQPNSLLDVQANALAIDPANPGTLYLGADLGVWRSVDSGLTWQTWSEGLPDAGVMDLALHGPKRILRAATHGRGVWERALGAGDARPVELVVRSTQLDSGRFAALDGLADPTAPGQSVRIWNGPDIKVDAPTAAGFQFPSGGPISFLQFVDELSDDAAHVSPSGGPIASRVYVQVHNRGVVPANEVRVMLLLANASAGLPALPPGYDAQVRNGLPINTPDWHTVGSVSLNDLRAGFPQIAAFELPVSMLPPPAIPFLNPHTCVLALIHHPDDPFNNPETNVDSMTGAERKAAHKNLNVAGFSGSGLIPIVLPIRVNNADRARARVKGIRVDLQRYPGKARLIIPPLDLGGGLPRAADSAGMAAFKTWAKAHLKAISANQRSRKKTEGEWARQRVADVKAAVAGGTAMEVGARDRSPTLGDIRLKPGESRTLFLLLERPARARAGQTYEVTVEQTDDAQPAVTAGVTIRVVA